MIAEPTVLTGWGRAAPGAADVVTLDPSDTDALAEALAEPGRRGVIARGLGRSYGDPAQNSGGRVVQCTAEQRGIEIDDARGLATVAAGVSLADLLDVIVPRGWFVPVTPGTRYVTIGGAIASDIHGKNHHQTDTFGGSFGNHVVSLRLMLADGTLVEVGPDRDPELFWATVGGMGLTGVIVAATFHLIPIETSAMSVETRRIDHLDEIMARMADSDHTVRYSVAWLDLLATGRHLGRGVLTNGEHATQAQLPAGHAGTGLEYEARQLIGVPPVIPPAGVINQFTVRAFNEVWFRKAPRAREGELQSIPAYFHPLDLARNWNRVYGRNGFLQYQFVVPYEAEATLRTIIERISAGQVPTFLTVLKRFGPGNQGMLSFPTGGWTLAIDVAATYHRLADLLRQFDRLVLDAGGRHYLAKDCHMSAEAVRRGYPRLDEWRAVRDRVDPTGVFASDMSRRLGLTGP